MLATRERYPGLLSYHTTLRDIAFTGVFVDPAERLISILGAGSRQL
jgi:hypothetical protein